MKHELAMTTGTVVIRGGGDIGTGVAHRLYRSGFDILILEIEKPLVIRRKVAFAQAVFDGQTVVEGVKAVKACNRKEIETIWGEGNVPIIIDPHLSMVREVKSEVLVDAWARLSWMVMQNPTQVFQEQLMDMGKRECSGHHVMERFAIY